MRLDVDVSVDGGLLDDIAGRLDNMQPGLLALGELFREREARLFATGGNGAWAANDPDTINLKGSARVLVDDGGLLRSLTRRGDRQHVERVTSDSITMGTRDPVAALLRRGGGMPRRDPVPPTTAAERERYGSTLLDWLLTGQA